MPQSAPPVYRTETGKSFQIAQGPTHTETPVPGTPAEATRTETKQEKYKIGDIPDPHLLFSNSVLVVLVLIGFALAARGKKADKPRGFGNFAEFVAEALNNFTVGVIGPGGEKYTPLVGTVFLYILLMNLIGLFPGFHSPTSNLSITLALGLVIFCYVQYEGIRQNGVGGYFRHFMGPSIMGKFPELFFLLGPIELVSELIRPLTLAIRLFGNIFGEDVIIVVLAGLLGSLGLSKLGWLPVQIPVLFLSLITDVVQAMVFAILTCIYISLVSHHDAEGHHEEGA